MLTTVYLDPLFVDELQLIGEEHEFYTLVCAELDHFSQQGNQKAVLLFPPVSSRLRFLIHRLTEPYSTLASFSVGEGWQRRTVICHASIRISKENGESRTRSRDENRDRFWSSASPSKKWESGRGKQNWWKRKDKRPNREPYAAGGKHGARGKGEHWRGHVKDKGQMRAPEDGKYGHNVDGELLQSKNVSGVEKESCELLVGQEEVQCETESQEVQETIAGKLEDSGSEGYNLLICHKLHENNGKARRPGQVAAADPAGGPSDQDMRQDYVAEEQAGGLSVRSVDDQVVSDLRGIERSQKAELSSITKDLHEMKVVEQEDKVVKAEGHNDNWRKVAKEEAEMPVETREEAFITLVGQEQPELAVMVQEETEMRAVTNDDKWSLITAHKKAEQSGETQEKVGMSAETKEEATMPALPKERAEMIEMVQDEKEMNVEVHEEANIGMEPQEEAEYEAMPHLVEADYELQSRSNCESETHCCIDEEAAEKSFQESKPTVQDDEEQKMMEQLLVEIQANVCAKDVHIQPLQGDFSEFSEVQVDRGKYGHIIEVYGFSPELSAGDLMETFKEYRDKGFCLELVDETHALGIFSSPEEAFAASCQKHPAMKFRPLSQGSRQSKYRAYEKADQQTKNEAPGGEEEKSSCSALSLGKLLRVRPRLQNHSCSLIRKDHELTQLWQEEC
ncbi:R3H and coiled-coil domain-containing protein 1 isoform X2 [Dendrobates tinctorius]|uniref:R3H and coiled-coil domain-containing protein 1 isoform X2 n=1 Tax=Dendrobates tinctorius TaxID=92724 RepID=UPI003CC95CAF